MNQLADNMLENGDLLPLFGEIASRVINKIDGVETLNIESEVGSEINLRDYVSGICLKGKLSAHIFLITSQNSALKLVENMYNMGQSPEIDDEILLSAVNELLNISAGQLAMALSYKGIEIDISTPIISGKEEIMLTAQKDIPIQRLSIHCNIGTLDLLSLN